MIIMFTIAISVLIPVVLSDEYTCCYGKTCPLPVFSQYADYQYFIDNFGIIDEDACCASSSIEYSALWDGPAPNNITAETACVCKHAQTCDSGQNMAYSEARTCDGGCMTNTGCPDAYVDDCWYWGSCGCHVDVDTISLCGCISVDLNTGQCISVGYNLCLFSYAGHSIGSRGMTQRCDLPKVVCIQEETGVISGEYSNIGHFYGFPNYKGPNHFFHVNRFAYDIWAGPTYGEPIWSFQKNESSTTAQIFLNASFTGSFDDITSFNAPTVTFMGGDTYSIKISNGACEYTPNSTTFNFTTSHSTHTKNNPTLNEDKSDNSESETIIALLIVLIVVIVVGLFVVIGIRYRRQKVKAPDLYTQMNTVHTIQS